MCFNVANSSMKRADDPDWPRVTGVGFELPGFPTGFTLLSPLSGEWELVEGASAEIAGQDPVQLDFAIVARVNPAGLPRGGSHNLLGIPPGQPENRENATRFCVSGPFPDTLPNSLDPTKPIETTIELLINGVVVRFHRVESHGPSPEFGVWENPMRTVPLYRD